MHFPVDITNKKVGLLGGSFNPAHDGHLAISKKALEMGLDYVIWLIVPQNPLKPPYELSLEERIKIALDIVRHCQDEDEDHRIIISSLEDEIHTTNTYDTIRYLTTHFPDTKFVWLMGVDCLDRFHSWENYNKFTDIVDIIIFNRPGYGHLLYDSEAGKLLKPKTCEKYQAGVCFVQEELSNLSSTEIRNDVEKVCAHVDTNLS